MRDLIAAAGAYTFMFGCYLLYRGLSTANLALYIAAAAVMVLGCVLFCAADPFFER